MPAPPSDHISMPDRRPACACSRAAADTLVVLGLELPGAAGAVLPIPARRRPRCEHGGRRCARPCGRSRRALAPLVVVAATRRDDACRCFCIRAGVHRLPAPVVPSRQVFIGEPGAIPREDITSRLVGPPPPHHGRTEPPCDRSMPRWGSACTYPNDVSSTAGLSAESCRFRTLWTGHVRLRLRRRAGLDRASARSPCRCRTHPQAFKGWAWCCPWS